MQKNMRESTENINSNILSKGLQIFTFQNFYLRKTEFLECFISTLWRESKKKNYLFPSSFLLWYRNAFIKNFIFRKYHKLILTAEEFSLQRTTLLYHRRTLNISPAKTKTHLLSVNNQ